MNHSQPQNADQSHPPIMLLPSGSEIVFNSHRIVLDYEAELTCRSCEPIAQPAAPAAPTRRRASRQATLPRVPVSDRFIKAAQSHGQDPWQLLIDLAEDFGRRAPAILIISRTSAGG